VRYPWANDYRGAATVLYGHTPTPQEWVNGTMCLDTGVVFGGKLTALRYPEREVVAVVAQQVWYEPTRPLAPPRRPRPARPTCSTSPTSPATHDRHRGPRTITVRAEQAAAVLEVMSRFAMDPRCLLYLPPTMAPTAPSTRDGLLEHPAEAFAGYRAAGVPLVVCEEKHMGSRAVVLVCRDDAVGAQLR
jgi:protein phosphatase